MRDSYPGGTWAKSCYEYPVITDEASSIFPNNTDSTKVNKWNIQKIQRQKDPTLKLSLAVINCQSVRNKAAYLNHFITENNFDCVALSETWLNSVEIENNVTMSALLPAAYKISHVPRQEARGGGVAFIHRDHYKVRIDTSFTASSFESITTVMDVGSFTFRFVVIYRVPPSTKNKLQRSLFLKEFADLLELSTTQSGRLVLAGDFNVHWDKKDDAERNQLEKLLDSHNLVQHVREPTHQDGHTLDLVITRASDNLVNSCDVGEFISDHNALHVILNCCREHPARRSITYRSWKSIDIAALMQDIRSSLLSQPPPTNFDEALDLYNTILEKLLDKHAPVKQRVIVDHPSQPWINEAILSAKRERRKAERRWRKSGLEVHKLAYKDLCSNVKGLVANAKAKFYVQKIEDCEGDMKKLYKIVDGLLGREKPKVLPTASSDYTLAEYFSSFFISKILNIRQELADLECTLAKLSFENFEFLQRSSKNSLQHFRPTNTEEVTRMIKKSSAATCVLDPMPTSLIIKVLPQLIPYITDMVNIALSSDTFSSKLKLAIVHPLIKKPHLDGEILENYRPICNLPFISKVIERVVASRIKEHMMENGLLEEMQSAYKEAHSTETALLRVQNDVLSAVDNGKAVFLVLLDLSSAFDTVDHELLLLFLEKYVGLRGPVLNFLRSYLTGRSQRVSIHGVLSELTELTFGVPQGSVLGPLLFCMYTLPLGAILRHHGLSYHMYADDTQIYCTSDLKSPQEDITRVSLCVSDIRTWMIQNKLKINDNKTEFMMIKSPHTKLDTNIEFEIGSTKIEQSKSCRNLGVIFDCEMKLDDQIQSMCKSANFHLRNIRAVRQLLPDSAVKQLVHALVTSRLDYCNSLLYGLPDYKISRLQRILNTAGRIVARCPKRTHITPILHELHWLPVEMRIRFKLLLLVFKCVNHLAPEYLSDLIKPIQHDRFTRAKSQALLDIPNSRLVSYGDRSFSVCGPKEWNELPSYIRYSSSVDTFKSNLKPFLFREYHVPQIN